MTNLTQTPEWLALQNYYEVTKDWQMSDIILGDKNRLDNSAINLEGLKLNYALDFVTPDTIKLLTELAEARKVPAWRERMWHGEKINTTENRAALHVALRQSSKTQIEVDGRDVIAEIHATQKRVAKFVDEIRDGVHVGITQKPIRHIVNIGIGGSDLGPRLINRALCNYITVASPEVHFVANADAYELVELLNRLDAAQTMFIVVSKTFTTQETLLNAQTARAWVIEKLGSAAIQRHFVTVSANLSAVKNFGMSQEHVFPMWDWVGGRFSLWSAAGMSIALALGNEHYEKLLRGAEAMDTHFRAAPLDQNMPVMLALLGIWARNFMRCPAHVVLPYSERLRELPRYLQQLEMESNGKSVARDGKPTDVATTPLLFGEPGTVGQHGFHQWLHQGSEILSADFIGVLADEYNRPDHHQALLSNMAAQATALAFGQPNATAPQDVYAGNRPSNIITLQRLDPYNLGMLLALYEHKVFVQSVIWNINPFDQPGVELGKRMAKTLVDPKASKDAANTFVAELYAKLLK